MMRIYEYFGILQEGVLAARERERERHEGEKRSASEGGRFRGVCVDASGAVALHTSQSEVAHCPHTSPRILFENRADFPVPFHLASSSLSANTTSVSGDYAYHEGALRLLTTL